MGKPNNFNDENCESKSSSCIIWAGPEINCLKICSGDNLTVTIYELATELCTIMNQLDVSNYDLTCLNIVDGQVKDFKSLVNILIQKICTSNGFDSSARVINNGSINDVIVNLAPCFQYNDPSNGDLIITSPLTDYVQRIGIAICSILSNIATQKNAIINLSSRLLSLENKQHVPYQLPKLFPVCIADTGTAISLDVFVKTLEQSFCELSQSIGSTNAIYTAMVSQPANLNNAKALGTGGGTMGEKSGWSLDPKNLSDTIINIWTTLSDLRSAVTNIQQNCCNTLCDGIRLTFEATLETKILKLFFTGVIPNNLISCAANGALFKIEDYSGNSINVSVDIKNNLNNISGFAIDLNSIPLNFADDLRITSLFCFNDSDTGSMCQNFLETIVNNDMNCPAITVIPTINSVAYQFSHNSGTLTYSIQLFNSTNVMIQSQNISVNAPVVISDIFSSLLSNTSYKIRAQLITINSTKTCPFTPFTTLSNPCPSVLSVSAIILIP